jgi:hypothetical protein
MAVAPFETRSTTRDRVGGRAGEDGAAAGFDRCEVGAWLARLGLLPLWRR